ncbi:MAG: DASS family sodium-coupled anion symporter [Catalinimonas sp.]
MDTRYAALRHLVVRAWPLRSKLTWLLVVSVAAVAVASLLRTPALSDAGYHTLIILLLAAGLWITEAVPAFAVGLLVIGLELLFLSFRPYNPDPLDWEQFVNPWASPVIWLLLGGFFMATAAQRTSLDKRLSRVMVQLLGRKPGPFLLGIMLTTAVLSMFISNTATAALMLTIVTPFVTKLPAGEPFRRALPLGIALGASFGGMGTVIGSPPNAIALGYLQSAGADLTFLDWMLFGVPVSLALVMLGWAILYQSYARKLDQLPLVEPSVDSVATDLSAVTSRRLSARVTRLTHFTPQQWIVMSTFTVTVGLWLTSGWHGVSVAAVAFVPIVVFAVTGILQGEHVRLLPWDTLMLVAGGLALGVGIRETGLADFLVGRMALDPDGPRLLLLLALGYLTVVLSNIMSNTAAATILMPLGGTLLPDAAVQVSLVIGLSASAAVLLPISTPPNAIAYATGWLRQKDFTLVGATVALLGPPLFVWVTGLF